VEHPVEETRELCGLNRIIIIIIIRRLRAIKQQQ